MEVFGIQLNIVWEDKQATHARVRALLEGRALPPESLLVLPEMFSTGFSMDVARIAEGEERLTERFLAILASDYRCFVLGGVVTAGSDGRGRNEAVLFGPRGEEILRYQKIHPFSYGGETRHYEPGSQVKLFDWCGVNLAPFICYDLRFPEIFRHAVQRGAQLFPVIANWPQARADHWITLLRARAIENQAYVIGVNRCGADPKLNYSGHSLIVDPRGRVLTDAGEEECCFHASLDMKDLLVYREQFPALQDMSDPFCH